MKNRKTTQSASTSANKIDTDALADDLVRRGLCSPAIIDHPKRAESDRRNRGTK